MAFHMAHGTTKVQYQNQNPALVEEVVMIFHADKKKYREFSLEKI